MRRPAAILAALLFIVALPAAAAARPPAQSEHARILAYWTPARMAAAIPREFVRTPSSPIPDKGPGGGGGGGGGSTTVAGASWSGGGEVVKKTGRVYFTMGGSNWICSGSTINDGGDASYSLVLTAGHCAVDETTGEFATNWLYIPSFDTAPTYDCTKTTYGCWTALALVAHSGFVTAGGFNTEATTHDFAVAVVGAGGKTDTQLDALGSYPLKTTGVSAGDTMWAFGYPAAGKYRGKDLTYCMGPISTDPLNANLTWGMACDMTGGSSGGPWLWGTTSPADGSGSIGSLNSYGYSGVKSMFGPMFNADTQAVYQAALAATPAVDNSLDTIVVP